MFFEGLISGLLIAYFIYAFCIPRKAGKPHPYIAEGFKKFAAGTIVFDRRSGLLFIMSEVYCHAVCQTIGQYRAATAAEATIMGGFSTACYDYAHDYLGEKHIFEKDRETLSRIHHQ